MQAARSKNETGFIVGRGCRSMFGVYKASNFYLCAQSIEHKALIDAVDKNGGSAL